MKLAARPILTQSVTTAVLFATGDTMAQQLVEKKGLEKHDLARTGRMALYGGGELSISSPTIAELIVLLHSCLRSRCHNLV
jgi:protein Mpv17